MAPQRIRQWATVALKIPFHGHGIRVGQLGTVLSKPTEGHCLVEFMDEHKQPVLQCQVPLECLLLLHLNDDALYPVKPVPVAFYGISFIVFALISGASMSMAFLLWAVPQTVDVLISGGARVQPKMVHVLVNPLAFASGAVVSGIFAWVILQKMLRK